MPAPDSPWLRLNAWLIAAHARLPTEWPPELPPEGAPGFWFRAAQLEMSTRDAVSAKLRSLAAGGGPLAMTALEGWFCHRRFEWASQVALAKAEAGVEPPPTVPLAEVLAWALVTTWETDGCLAFWNNAERDGQPPPDNPDRRSPC